MPNITDFSILYDWSLIEKGIQAFFVAADLGGAGAFVAPKDDDDPNRETWTPPAGQTPFYTAFQSLTFQKCRPRVSVSLDGIVPFGSPPPMIVDANNQLRVRAWRGQLDFAVITNPSYAQHTALRALVQSVIATMVPVLGDINSVESTGVNANLTYHEIATCWDAGNNTGIHAEQGYYGSQLKYAITFGIRAAAWPGGFNLTT
jgi:hypothetical protein